MTETLRIWPALPIIISVEADGFDDGDDIVVALEQRDRVREIRLDCYPYLPLETVLSAMLVSFPALKRLSLTAHEVPARVFPDTFLGGSAPRLQSLYLYGISFPALPNLLLSVRDLVDLRLSDIRRSGSFLPEELVNSISDLSRLKTLFLEFRSRRSCPVPGTRSPPMARAVFPALDRLCFEGVSGYLDDLVSRIDAPLIRLLYMTFFNQPFVASDFCQLREFIGRAEKFKSLTHARINFRFRTAEISLSEPTRTYHSMLSIGILCNNLHPQLWSLAQIGSSDLLPLSRVESLEVISNVRKWRLHHEHTEEDGRWLNVLRPFSAVKNLYLRHRTLPSLAYALKELPEERVTEVLPTLQLLNMEKPSPDSFEGPSPPAVQEAIERFIAMRRLPP